MAGLESLAQRYDSVRGGIVKLVVDRKRVLVVTHIDADGLISGSLVFAALKRKGANVALRCIPELDPAALASLAGQNYDFYIFTDLASTMIKELDSALGGRFLAIDHHQIAEDDRQHPSVVNAWAFGYDGGTEACSSSMAYFFAEAIDQTNVDLSYLAVVGAVADRQDGGSGRSLTGLNAAALERAQGAGLVAVSKDLLLTGRETRPVHEAVALTSTPYLKGLTGSKDAVLATLHQSGLTLKEGGVWRTPSSLTAEEKMKLTEVLASAAVSGGAGTEAMRELVGDVFTLQSEDPFTPLRDAREFATLLNSCGRMGKPGVGASICLGDRSASLKEAADTLHAYRGALGRALQGLADDPSKTVVQGSLVVVRGEGVVDEKLLGPVISILSGSPGNMDKVIVGLSLSGDSELKVSSRAGDSYGGGANLALVMREAAEAAGGVGGGHSMAAGAKIPLGAADAFLRSVGEKLVA